MHITLDNIVITDDINARTGDSADYIWDTTALANVSDDVGKTELMKMHSIQQTEAGKNNFGRASLICVPVSVF